jgi:translation initiation factor 4A
MLSRGFVEEVRSIFENLPAEVQVCLFSATMPPEILEITDKFMKDPVKILVKNEELTLDGIKQFYISMEKDEQKFPTLLQIYKNMAITQCMVFTNRKERVQELAENLRKEKFIVSAMHGEMEMQDRVNIMKEFRSGSTRILISTDLLGRGIDIQQVNLIINYDMPNDTSKYIHRIGRSGRFGRKGVAINLVTPGDADFLMRLKSHYNTQIEELPFDLSNIYN